MMNCRAQTISRAVWECCCLGRPFTTAPGQIRKTAQPQTYGKNKKKQQSRKLNSCSQEEAALRNRLLQRDHKSNTGHVYKNLYPWRTRIALAEELRSSEIYNNDGLIALCKPYGVAQVGTNVAVAPGLSGVAGGVLPDNLPSVSDVIPELCRMYGEPQLHVIKSSERWSSGVLLLSVSPQVTEKVQKCWQRARALKQTSFSYWAVTVGLPRPASGATKAVVRLEYVRNIGNVPVVVKDYTIGSLKRQEVKLSAVEHLSLMYNKDTEAALVQVKTQMQRNHFLRLWLTHIYSPALGDSLLSSRVSTITGKRIQVSPHNITSYQPQVIPEVLYSKLELPPGKVELIPCHLHLRSVHLSMFNKDKSDLTITASPPEHFMWTCKQLGLMSDEGVDGDEELLLEHKKSDEAT